MESRQKSSPCVGLTHKVTWGKDLMKLREQPTAIWRNSIPGIGWSQCKGPVAGHAWGVETRKEDVQL